MRVLYENGRLVTMDPTMPQAEALVTEGGRILAGGEIVFGGF